MTPRNIDILGGTTLGKMSKITFRADDDLVARLEDLDASKSEVMREALREHLDTTDRSLDSGSDRESFDQLVSQLIGEHVDDRLPDRSFTQPGPQDINVNITVDGKTREATTTYPTDSDPNRKTNVTPTDRSSDMNANSCVQCGSELSSSHVYCPNCGEKANHRIFCDCGDEIRSDWSFCPGCGRRTPTADVLDGE